MRDVDLYIGNKIRIRRKMLGLSQKDLADAVKVTFQQIQKYEKGVNKVVLSRLFEIAKVLDVHYSYFFDEYFNEQLSKISPYIGFSDSGADDHPFGKSEFNEFVKDKEIVDLVQVYSKIKCKDVRSKIFSLIKSISDSEFDLAETTE